MKDQLYVEAKATQPEDKVEKQPVQPTKTSAVASQLDKLSLAEYMKLRLEDVSLEHTGKKIRTFGWVTKCTPMKSRCFVHLTSAFSTIKCVIEGEHSFTFQTSVTICGTVVVPKTKKDEFEFEICVEKYEVYNGKMAPPFPLNTHSEKETRLDNGHLALRLDDRRLFLKARAVLLRTIRDFYDKGSYLEITPPTLVQTQVEGGATLFSLDYYGAKAYLTQSSQLYLETVAPITGKAYCIISSYRAEKSNTFRHLSEYSHVEAEIVDVTFSELMDAVEALVKFAVKGFYKHLLSEIKAVYADFEPLEISDEPFKRLSYTDAIEFLRSKGHLKSDGTEYQYMDDISSASEKYLCEEYSKGQPMFLTHFPHALKAFYMKKVGGDLTESCDLLFPGVGETVGGSMRQDSYEDLLASFEGEGISPKPYYWYLDMSRYGPSCHGGYGLGLERLLMGIMKYKHVDQACLYPRKVSRCQP